MALSYAASKKTGRRDRFKGENADYPALERGCQSFHRWGAWWASPGEKEALSR